VTRFVILAAPRTGSNWLCTLLDSHPRVLCHREIFNPGGIHTALSLPPGALDLGPLDERDRDPEALLRRVWAADCGHAAVGFKLNRESTPGAFAPVLDDRGVRKIALRRDNRLRTCVSELLAIQTGAWESLPGSPPGAPRQRLRLTASQVRAHAARNARYYAGLTSHLRRSGQAWLETRYEDLGERDEHARLLGFLDLERAPEGLRGASARRNPEPLRTLVANFDELREELRGSPFEEELDGD
jgi:hypothetical protein